MNAPVAQIVGWLEIAPLELRVGDGTHGTSGLQPEVDGGQLKHQAAGAHAHRLLHHVAVDGTQELLRNGGVVVGGRGSSATAGPASRGLCVRLHEGVGGTGAARARDVVVDLQRQGDFYVLLMLLLVGAQCRQLAQQAVAALAVPAGVLGLLDLSMHTNNEMPQDK